MDSPSVVVICTGNICRSPMAEGLLRRMIGDRFLVSSAGIHAMTNWRADPLAVQVCAEASIDISAHRARQADRMILSAATVVLAAASEHLRWVRHAYPQYAGRTFLLSHQGDKADIEDPYQGGADDFRRCFATIERDLALWVTKLDAF